MYPLSLLMFVALSLAPNTTIDVRDATIESIHHALRHGLASCREVIESFIARIEAYNPALNAMIALNPDALSAADACDEALARGRFPGALFCVPVLLKDNYDAAGMATTGGSLALAGTRTREDDAPTVAALKRAGAIVLGKTNMHELGLEGLSLGGQTVNPYDRSRTPGGSSGGTAAAVAASFAVFGTGTDTMNSLRSPARANSLFSLRPTRGLVSRAGVMPISCSQDAVGPIARDLSDLAVALTVMAGVGYDPDDDATALASASAVCEDYSTALDGGSLRDVRFGVMEGFFNRTPAEETSPVNKALDAVISSLAAAGASIVTINSSIYNATAISSLYDVQKFEFKQEMNDYLNRSSPHGTTHPSTLDDVYASGKFLVIPDQYPFVKTALVSSPSNTTYADVKLGIQTLTGALLSTFATRSLTAILYPEQKNLVVKLGSPSQSGRNGILAAVTGFPVLTVPAGFSPVNA